MFALLVSESRVLPRSPNMRNAFKSACPVHSWPVHAIPRIWLIVELKRPGDDSSAVHMLLLCQLKDRVQHDRGVSRK